MLDNEAVAGVIMKQLRVVCRQQQRHQHKQAVVAMAGTQRWYSLPARAQARHLSDPSWVHRAFVNWRSQQPAQLGSFQSSQHSLA